MIKEIKTSIESNLQTPEFLLSNCDSSVPVLLAKFCDNKAWKQTTERYFDLIGPLFFADISKSRKQRSDRWLSSMCPYWIWCVRVMVFPSIVGQDTSDEAETGRFFLLESLARDYRQCCLIEMNLILVILGVLQYLQVTIPGGCAPLLQL